MFANVSPSQSDAGESMCSLNFAVRVRGVELGAVRRNIDAAADVRALQEQVAAQQKQVRPELCMPIPLTCNAACQYRDRTTDQQLTGDRGFDLLAPSYRLQKWHADGHRHRAKAAAASHDCSRPAEASYAEPLVRRSADLQAAGRAGACAA